jgi:hypothetical protein
MKRECLCKKWPCGYDPKCPIHGSLYHFSITELPEIEKNKSNEGLHAGRHKGQNSSGKNDNRGNGENNEF